MRLRNNRLRGGFLNFLGSLGGVNYEQLIGQKHFRIRALRCNRLTNYLQLQKEGRLNAIIIPKPLHFPQIESFLLFPTVLVYLDTLRLYAQPNQVER